MFTEHVGVMPCSRHFTFDACNSHDFHFTDKEIGAQCDLSKETQKEDSPVRCIAKAKLLMSALFHGQVKCTYRHGRQLKEQLRFHINARLCMNGVT